MIVKPVIFKVILQLHVYLVILKKIMCGEDFSKIKTKSNDFNKPL